MALTLRSLFLLLVFYSVGASVVAKAPTAVGGVLDARSFDIAHERLSLQGDWIFFENRLLSPAECKSDHSGVPMQFPKLWNERGTGHNIDYGTYSLTVTLPANQHSLAFALPQIYSSYSIWVNGILVAENGKVGTTKETTLPQWKPQTVSFKTDEDSLHIVLQIANFYHFKSGSKEQIFLGGSEMMEYNRRVATSSNVSEAIILGVIGLICLVIWQSDRKKIILYFALLCFTWALRSVFSNLYLFITVFPDFDWSIMVKIEYITLFGTMIWAILFINKLFPSEGKPLAKYLLVGVNVLFIVCSVFFEAVMFTRMLPVYLSFCGFLLIYGAFIIVRAWINDHAGVWFSILSLLFGLLIFGYDMFAYEGLFAYNPVIFGLGYVIIFLFLATSLLLHLNILKSKPGISVLTYQDLYGESTSNLKS